MDEAGGDECRSVCYDRGGMEQVGVRVDWFVLRVVRGSRWGIRIDWFVLSVVGWSWWG